MPSRLFRILIVLAGIMGADGVVLAAASAHQADASRLASASSMLLFHATAVLGIVVLAERAIVHARIGIASAFGFVIASALFAVYVANFSHYNKIYGSLAGVIVFLIWMWISNVAILFGAEFNAELERGRAVAGGHPIEEEPFSELRDDRKLRKKEQKKEKQSRS